jgi:hypothetical protein
MTRGACARWCDGPPAEGEPRFAGYVAALDQEESAAARYASLIGEITRRLRPSPIWPADARA